MLVTKEEVSTWRGHHFDNRYNLRTVLDYLKAHPMSTSEEIYFALTEEVPTDLNELRIKKQRVMNTLSKLRQKG